MNNTSYPGLQVLGDFLKAKVRWTPSPALKLHIALIFGHLDILAILVDVSVQERKQA